MNTIRYDKRCYFYVHSKAGMSQLLNLRTETTTKSVKKTEQVKSKNGYAQE